MTKLLYIISRIVLGAVFVFSGFAKSVDPTGSAIKFTDYFTAFGVEGLAILAMPAAFILSGIEFLIGIQLLVGARMRLFSLLALVFMVFFTPLTFYIAIANPVSDCGCFGDALKIGNWETFFKNIVLFVLSLFLFLKRKEITNSISGIRSYAITAFFSLAILSISYYSLQHLPILDFRPYSLGSNIAAGMTIPEGAEQPVYETTFVLEKNGEKKTFSAENYPYTDSAWVFVDSETKVIKEGYQTPIKDFMLTDAEGSDLTQTVLSSDAPVLFVVSYQIDKGKWNKGKQEKIIELKNSLISQGVKTYFLTASSSDDITKFEFDNDAGFDYLNADETMLKTMIRANPGLVLLQKGTVVGKWHNNDLPNADELKIPLSLSVKQIMAKQDDLLILAFTLVALLVAILLVRKNK